jgi:HD superfamily phosphohydrolase YqeK
MTDASSLADLLPELTWIEDPELRAKCAEIWVTLHHESNFPTISDVPVSPTLPYPHVVHNRSVVHMARATADVVQEFHNVTVNRDHLYAAALLQDAAKLVEFDCLDPVSRKVVHSDLGRRFQHSLYVAHLALSAHLDFDIVEAILDHTYSSSRFPRTLIGKILYYTDQIDMAALGGDNWKKSGMIWRG